MTSTFNRVDSHTDTYLTFTLEDETFAVEVANVREVLDYITITKVPRTPDFMRGVINLRGAVVPVVDMRARFGMPQIEDTVDTCIIVMEISYDGESTVIGAVADSVNEVFDVSSDNIEPPPQIGTSLDLDFIKGMGKYNEQFIIILDINMVFSDLELETVKEISEHAPVLAGEAPLYETADVDAVAKGSDSPAEATP